MQSSLSATYRKPVQLSTFSIFIVSYYLCCSWSATAHTHLRTQIFTPLFAVQEVRGQADVTLQPWVQKVRPTDFQPPAGIDISVEDRKVKIYNPKYVEIFIT